MIPLTLACHAVVPPAHFNLRRFLTLFIKHHAPFHYMQYLFLTHTSPSVRFRTILVCHLIKGNRSHKAPLVVRQQAERSDSIKEDLTGLCHSVKVIRITVYPLGINPPGAWLRRWQSLHLVCKYHDHHKTCLSSATSSRRVALRGHRAEMHFTKSFLGKF